MANGWRGAAACAALVIGLAGPVAGMAQTAAATATAKSAFEERSAKAEQEFQKGEFQTGLKLLLPFIYGRDMQRGQLYGEAVKALLTRYPDALASFKTSLRHSARKFDNKAELVGVARLIDWAFLQGLIGLTEHRSLQKTLAVIVRERTIVWKYWLYLSDPYQEIPGLTDPDIEREIFKSSVDEAKTSSGNDYLVYMILTYASAHRDEEEVVRTVISDWPKMVMSAAFREKVETLYPFIAYWRKPPKDPKPLDPPSRSERFDRFVRQQERVLNELERSRRQSEETHRQRQRDQEERERDASRREEDRRNEEARRQGLERARELARQNEERMRDMERQRQEAERRREEEIRQFNERARQQAEAKAAEERRQQDMVRENIRRMEEERRRAEQQRKF